MSKLLFNTKFHHIWFKKNCPAAPQPTPPHLLPIFWWFLCSQAHNILTCDQPDPKDKFSQIKKKYESIRHYERNLRDGPLNPFQIADMIEIVI